MNVLKLDNKSKESKESMFEKIFKNMKWQSIKNAIAALLNIIDRQICRVDNVYNIHNTRFQQM